MLSILLGALLFAAVAAFVLVPVLSSKEPSTGGEDPELADLEARRESKYREISDTDLDHASGKLSDEDFARQDAELRNEAVGILDELDQVHARPAGPDRDPSG